MKKLMLGLLPLVAVVAFAAMPAMASAATREYGICEASKTEETKPPCAAKEVFKAFKVKTEVTTKGTKEFVLQTFVEKEGKIEVTSEIKCTTLADSGTVENVGGIGKSEETLDFTGCTTVIGGVTCALEPIKGPVTNEVTGMNTVEIKVTTPGIAVVSAGTAGCPAKGAELGKVTGTASAAISGDTVTFTNATGLEFGASKARISGADSMVTTVGSHPVFVN